MNKTGIEIKLYLPQPALQDSVQSIMIFGLQSGKEKPMPVNPFPPVPQHSLFFYLKEPVHIQPKDADAFVAAPRGLIVGPQLSRVDTRMGHDHLLIHIAFKPGGLHRLTGIPMHQLLDTAYNASDLLGAEADRVMEQLRNTTGWQAMVALVETFLLKRLKAFPSAEPFDRAISQLIHGKGSLPIEKAAAAACLSLKQFERKCKSHLGMPPKLFARLIRFSTAYRMRELNQDISWTSICYECGYYDQMHLIRDFKEFAGVTPRIISCDLRETPYRLQSNIQL